MKIAITAQDKKLSAPVDPRFGRCAFIILYDTEKKSWEVIDIQNIQVSDGAGIQTTQKISEKNVDAILTGHIGPNAFETLWAAEIDVYTGVSGIVSEVINQFISGQLIKYEVPTVQSQADIKPDSQMIKSPDTKRIAVASDGQEISSPVSSHFGRCPFYHLFDIQNDTIIYEKSLENPFSNVHGQPGQIPKFINDQGVHVILAGGMGQRAVGFFEQFGIEIATGIIGSVENAVEAYLNGSLSGYTPCNHNHGDCM